MAFLPRRRRRKSTASAIPRVSGTPTLTNNLDGTATLAFTTDIAAYTSVDYGTSANSYFLSAFDYSGAGPALNLGTAHSIRMPDLIPGGTIPSATYFYRIFGATASDSSGRYIDIERSGIIATRPVLSSPTVAASNSTTLIPRVTTNEPGGTLYWAVVTNAGSCTDAQLKAGSGGNIVAGKAGSKAVSVGGIQTGATITGLTAATTYQVKYLQTNNFALDSTQASASVTTAATPAITQDTAVSGNNLPGGLSPTTATITTGGINRLLVAALSIGQGAGTPTAISVSGGGLTWNQGPNNIQNGCYNAIWWAYATTALTSQVITASWTTNNPGLLEIVALIGAKDLTPLVVGTDYATDTNTGSNLLPVSNSVVSKVTGSLMLSASTSRTGAAYTPDINNVVVIDGTSLSGGLGGVLLKFAYPESTTISTGYVLGGSVATATYGWSAVSIEIPKV